MTRQEKKKIYNQNCSALTVERVGKTNAEMIIEHPSALKYNLSPRVRGVCVPSSTRTRCVCSFILTVFSIRRHSSRAALTLLGLQSRFGDNWVKNTWNLRGLSPKRDCSSKRVNHDFVIL